MTTSARTPREINGKARAVQQLAECIWNPDRLEREASL